MSGLTALVSGLVRGQEEYGALHFIIFIKEKGCRWGLKIQQCNSEQRKWDFLKSPNGDSAKKSACPPLALHAVRC